MPCCALFPLQLSSVGPLRPAYSYYIPWPQSAGLSKLRTIQSGLESKHENFHRISLGDLLCDEIKSPLFVGWVIRADRLDFVVLDLGQKHPWLKLCTHTHTHTSRKKARAF